MKDLLQILVEGDTLTQQQTMAAFEQIMTGQAEPVQVSALLAMMQQRGPTVEELSGAATVMRSKVAAVVVPGGLTAIDTCGTGGDHSGTFNISTAAAVVAAGIGREHNVVVAKHGNRSVTSKSGSSQVLEALGVNLQVTPEKLTQCLAEAGICFCFAPAHHPAMKHVMPIRLGLGIRTIFNLLGPLTNPAGAKRQVMGVFDAKLTEPLAEVLMALGGEDVMVVHGRTDAGGMDEIVNTGPTQISRARDGKVITQTITPDAVGIAPATLAALQADGPEQSAKMIQSVLAGETGPARDIVCMNAGAALTVGGLAEDLSGGIKLAQQSIDQGLASKALERLVKITSVS